MRPATRKRSDREAGREGRRERTSPLVQASAPRPVKEGDLLSHLRKTLDPGVPVLPLPTSLEVGGQWPVCCAGASPTEDPMTARRGDHINSQVSCVTCVLSRTLCYIQGVRRVRAAISRVALLWIVWQAAALVSAPMVMAYAASGDALTEQLCECPDAAPGRQCPMHHHSSSTAHPSSSDDGSARCSARAPVTPTESALALMSTVVGMVPVRAAVRFEPQFVRVVTVSSADVFSRSTPPLSPPPKA